MEFTLLWAALTAVAFGWAGLRIWDDRLPTNAGDRLLMALLVGLFVGRVTAMIGQGVNPITHPGELIVIRGGVDTAAATTGFIVSLIWSSREAFAAVDAMAPATLFGLAGWQTGCVWRNACLGSPSNLPWAWAQDAGTVSRHPVELYAALALIIGAYIVARLGWRPWLRSGVALSLAAGVRLLTQPLRPSLGAGPVGWYGAAMIIGLFLVIVGPRLVGTRSQAST